METLFLFYLDSLGASRWNGARFRGGNSYNSIIILSVDISIKVLLTEGAKEGATVLSIGNHSKFLASSTGTSLNIDGAP